MQAITRLSVLGALALTCACGDDDDAPASPQDVTLQFNAVVGGTQAQCGTTYTNIGTTNASMEFRDLRFYVSEVALLTNDGTAAPVTLTADAKWQNETVGLLDFEDKSGSCANGTTETNNILRGTVAAGDYTGVRFTLGVPFGQNHQDPTTAVAPLNVQSMFWVWQTGHKFAKIDIKGTSGSGSNWNMHLGSTDCTLSGNDPIPTVCNKPNRPTYTFSNYNAGNDAIQLDVAALFANSDISKDTSGATGCMSGAQDAECTHVFSKLGMNLATGTATADGFDSQGVFTVVAQ